MNMPAVVSAEEWQRARDELLVAEKEHTRAGDRLAARRRRLPMVKWGTDYVFEGANGPASLVDLFDGARQLVVYQFMDLGPDRFCPGCTNFSRDVTNLDSIRALDLQFVTVTDVPFARIDGYRRENGWDWPFYSSRGSTWSEDIGASDGFGFNVFLRDGDDVFRTYQTAGRGVDILLFDDNIADLTPYGRQEAWEDSPEGWPGHD